MPTTYTDEFKRGAVSLVLTQGLSQKQVCPVPFMAEVGITHGWRQEKP